MTETIIKVVQIVTMRILANYKPIKMEKPKASDYTGNMRVYAVAASAYIDHIEAINTDLLENLTRIIDRIEENKLANTFPSAFLRAVCAIKKATK